MNELHVVLVCHTELDFDGSWGVYRRVQPRIEDLLKRVADKSGKQPKMTYCLTSDFLSERLEDAFRFLEEGHEIGVHSHLPGAHRPRHSYAGHYAYHLNEHGILNQDTVAGALRQISISLGLPPPRTHVSGMFTFQRTTIQVLAEAGFSVDCSLLPGIRGTHEATGDFVLADNTRRDKAHAYRPSDEDPWADGDSAIIELPASANLGGGDMERQISDLRRRVTSDRDVDVFQSYWHHFEFLRPVEFLRPGQDIYEEAERFLIECGRHDAVRFSTASEAASVLERSGL